MYTCMRVPCLLVGVCVCVCACVWNCVCAGLGGEELDGCGKLVLDKLQVKHSL